MWYNKTVDEVGNMCEPVNVEDLPSDFGMSVNFNGFLTPFMLADRGDCTFVTKVRNMEEAGAAVGIVIDNSDEDVNKVIMSDDGSGAGIEIPSMLISKEDG